jgi:hypothetical protein
MFNVLVLGIATVLFTGILIKGLHELSGSYTFAGQLSYVFRTPYFATAATAIESSQSETQILLLNSREMHNGIAPGFAFNSSSLEAKRKS